MDVARALRTRGVAAPIVFFTSSPDFAVQSYEVEAFSYVEIEHTHQKFRLTVALTIGGRTLPHGTTPP